MGLKGALVGLGNIAYGSHIPAYLDQQEQGVEIVAGCDRSEENRLGLAEFFPAAKTYEDYQELFANHQLDFVGICTPPNSHYKIIEAAAAHGVHVLCEKPLCTSIKEMGQIIKLVQEKNLVFMPCHQYHFAPQWQKIISMIAEGAIGTVLHAHFEVYRKEPNPGNKHWKSNWRIVKEKSGGGIIQDHGTHLFYLASSVLGEPEVVSARLNSFLHKNDDLEDSAWITSQHKAGVAKFDVTWASFQRRINYRILGDQGELLLNEKEICYINKNGQESFISTNSFSGDSLHTSWFKSLINIFLENVRSQTCNHDWLKEAARCFVFAQVAYLSSCEKRHIVIRSLFEDTAYTEFPIESYKYLFSAE